MHELITARERQTQGSSYDRPNLIIFGNARGGTPLMQASQTSGIDLPLKALVWQDAAGKTWLSYNEPSWIVQRHGLGVRAEIVDKMAAALSAISRKAADPRSDADNVAGHEVSQRD